MGCRLLGVAYAPHILDGYTIEPFAVKPLLLVGLLHDPVKYDLHLEMHSASIVMSTDKDIDFEPQRTPGIISHVALTSTGACSIDNSQAPRKLPPQYIAAQQPPAPTYSTNVRNKSKVIICLHSAVEIAILFESIAV